MSLVELLYDTFVKKIQVINVPEFIEYDHGKVEDILQNQLGWRYYGGHHHESIYTEFFQSYYLPVKFNIDKRKLEYSALIRSGQMTREDALREVQEPYPLNKKIVEYAISKLDLTEAEFQEIMESPPKSFENYPNYYPIIKICKTPVKWACNLNLLPYVFYEKYLG
jgi:hypothetical protein